MITHFAILATALLLDRVVGDPDWLWRRLPHPVVWFGKLIAIGEKRLNNPSISQKRLRSRGIWLVALLVVGSLVTGLVLNIFLFSSGIVGLIIEVMIVTVLLAQKSLLDHVRAVADGLRAEGLAGGRQAVSMIVGRDPTTLSEAGVSRAAIESLSENFSDGVVAPAFWYALLGLPGLLAYKMINTADSMIGHLSDRYRAFGFAAARLDDWVNWPAARLSALLITLAKPLGVWSSLKIVLRDASLHRSPNAGWPEAAMAAVSDLALGGPRIYAGDIVKEPFINGTGRKDAGPGDIERCMRFVDIGFFIGVALLVAAIAASL